MAALCQRASKARLLPPTAGSQDPTSRDHDLCRVLGLGLCLCRDLGLCRALGHDRRLYRDRRLLHLQR